MGDLRREDPLLTLKFGFYYARFVGRKIGDKRTIDV